MFCHEKLRTEDACWKFQPKLPIWFLKLRGCPAIPSCLQFRIHIDTSAWYNLVAWHRSFNLDSLEKRVLTLGSSLSPTDPTSCCINRGIVKQYMQKMQDPSQTTTRWNIIQLLLNFTAGSLVLSPTNSSDERWPGQTATGHHCSSPHHDWPLINMLQHVTTCYNQ